MPAGGRLFAGLVFLPSEEINAHIVGLTWTCLPFYRAWDGSLTTLMFRDQYVPRRSDLLQHQRGPDPDLPQCFARSLTFVGSWSELESDFLSEMLKARKSMVS